MNEKETSQDIKSSPKIDADNTANSNDYESNRWVINLDASDDELDILDQVFSKEEYSDTSPETKCNLYNECIGELRALREQLDDSPDMIVRDYLVASHANLDDDSLLENYLKRELSIWEGGEKQNALEQYLVFAKEYDWNPKQKSELFLTICEQAFQNFYLDIAKNAIDELRDFETAPAKEISLEVTQGARIRFYDALITAARAEENDDSKQLATAQFCSAIEFCINFLPQQHNGDLAQLLLEFLQTEKQFVETKDKERCLVMGYSLIHHLLRPGVDKIISEKDYLEKEAARKFLRLYVDCQAKFAIMLQSKNAHENAYEIFDDACKIQQILADTEKIINPLSDEATRVLEVLRNGQEISLAIMQGLMKNELDNL